MCIITGSAARPPVDPTATGPQAFQKDKACLYRGRSLATLFVLIFRIYSRLLHLSTFFNQDKYILTRQRRMRGCLGVRTKEILGEENRVLSPLFAQLTCPRGFDQNGVSRGPRAA